MPNLKKIAEEFNLEVIETTSESNGYPLNVEEALIGFESFEQAENIAEEFNLEISSFNKKDGWNLWYRNGGRPLEPFSNSQEDYGDNYQDFPKTKEEEFIEDEVKWFFENDPESFEQMEAFLKQKKEIWEEILKMNDDELVITFEGSYHETIKKKSMYFYHDTKHYIIGLKK